MKVFNLFLTIFFWMAHSCSSSNKNLNQPKITPEGHYQLYSHPHWVDVHQDNNRVRRLVIVGTNDFHGNLMPSYVGGPKKINSNENIRVPIGGVGIISGYFNILRKRYPAQTLFLDAGDLYQGTLISNPYKGKPVVQFYNYLNYDALTVGNHEFDFGPKGGRRTVSKHFEDPRGALKYNMQQSKIPFVVSNIQNLKTGSLLKGPHTGPYLLKTVNNIKVGVIGTTTLETPEKTVIENVRGLYFKNMATTIVKYSKVLKQKGAQVIVLLTHSGVKCGEEEAKARKVSIEKINFNPQDISSCDKDGELLKVLSRLKPGTIDAVVAGHTHSKIANFINGIPVIQSFHGGQYFSRIELYFDMNKEKIIADRTVIHQPTRFCHRFFKETNDCYEKDRVTNPLDMVPATFLGLKVTRDSKIENILRPYIAKVEKTQKKILVNIDETLYHSRFNYSEVGGLVADAIRWVTKSDIAITNSGGVRNHLESGPVTLDTIYKIIPFDNSLVTMKMTGKQVKELVQIATSGGTNGLGCLSGVKVWMRDGQENDFKDDLNGDGKFESWERNRVLRVTTLDGTPINPEQVYTVATQTYLGINGGDNYRYIFKQIPDKKKQVYYTLSYRQALAQYLEDFRKKGKVVNSKKHPYANLQRKWLHVVQ